MSERYADQRARDVTWMTAAGRDELEREREAAGARLARAHAECEARRAAAPPVPGPPTAGAPTARPGPTTT